MQSSTAGHNLSLMFSPKEWGVKRDEILAAQCEIKDALLQAVSAVELRLASSEALFSERALQICARVGAIVLTRLCSKEGALCCDIGDLRGMTDDAGSVPSASAAGGSLVSGLMPAALEGYASTLLRLPDHFRGKAIHSAAEAADADNSLEQKIARQGLEMRRELEHLLQIPVFLERAGVVQYGGAECLQALKNSLLVVEEILQGPSKTPQLFKGTGGIEELVWYVSKLAAKPEVFGNICREIESIFTAASVALNVEPWGGENFPPELRAIIGWMIDPARGAGVLIEKAAEVRAMVGKLRQENALLTPDQARAINNLINPTLAARAENAAIGERVVAARSAPDAATSVIQPEFERRVQDLATLYGPRDSKGKAAFVEELRQALESLKSADLLEKRVDRIGAACGDPRIHERVLQTSLRGLTLADGEFEAYCANLLRLREGLEGLNVASSRALLPLPFNPYFNIEGLAFPDRLPRLIAQFQSWNELAPGTIGVVRLGSADPILLAGKLDEAGYPGSLVLDLVTYCLTVKGKSGIYSSAALQQHWSNLQGEFNFTTGLTERLINGGLLCRTDSTGATPPLKVTRPTGKSVLLAVYHYFCTR
ncbi:MAG: hypothetical protein K1X79_10835 [Oligoflexia bacterium]|nr:hypothetical protein [Oligoflexia bacterium]